MKSKLAQLSVEQLKRALSVKEQIADLELELESILGAPEGVRKGGRPAGRAMSALARAKIAAAQRARWARVKKTGLAAPVAKAKGPRKMSPAARAKIAAAAKKRWAAAKASGKTTLAS